MKENGNGARVFGSLMVTVVSFCIGIMFGRYIAPTGTDILSFPTSKKVDIGLFWDVWDILKDKYVEKDMVSEEDMVYGAVKGLVNSYGDPAQYFYPKRLKVLIILIRVNCLVLCRVRISDGNIIIVAP